jgi:ribosomal protein S8E
LSSYQPALSDGHLSAQLAQVPQDLGSRGSLTSRRRSTSWDALLPTLRLAPTAYPWSEFEEALRLDVGNFPWGSEYGTHKTRILDVIYNAANNELFLTKTPVKNCIVFIDSTPYWQWFKSHYALAPGHKKWSKLIPEEEEISNKKWSKKIQKNYDERKIMPKSAVFWRSTSSRASFLSALHCCPANGYVLRARELNSTGQNQGWRSK